MNENAFVIRVAQSTDLEDVALIHHSSLPDGFLPQLGLDFLRKVYYPATVRSTHAATLVAVLDGRVIGFVTIALDSPSFSRDILWRIITRLPFYVLRRILVQPSFLIKCWQIFRATSLEKPFEIRSEIFYIAVEDIFRGRGLGKKLIYAALNFLREKGVQEVWIKTLSENTTWISMFEGMGWQINKRFKLIDEEYVAIVGYIENR